MFIVGIDIAKRSHMVRVIDSEGQTVCKPFSIRNSCSGCNVLLERLRNLTTQKSDFIFSMESTSHYWLALYTRLRKEGYQVVVLNPIQTNAMREMLMEENKTDDDVCCKRCISNASNTTDSQLICGTSEMADERKVTNGRVDLYSSRRLLHSQSDS